MVGKILCTFVLQTYGVQHTGGSLSHTGIRISFARLDSRPLHEDATETGNIEKVGVFDAITKCAGSSCYRILQLQTTYVYS